MKPFSTALAINASFLAISFLLDYGLFKHYDWFPLQLTLMAVFNMVIMGFFFYDKRRKIALPFLVFFVVFTAASTGIWMMYMHDLHAMGNLDPQYFESVWPVR